MARHGTIYRPVTWGGLALAARAATVSGVRSRAGTCSLMVDKAMDITDTIPPGSVGNT